MRRPGLVWFLLSLALLASCGGDRGFDADSGNVAVNDLPGLLSQAVAPWSAEEVARQALPPPACDQLERTSCRSVDPPSVAIAYHLTSGEDLFLQISVAADRAAARAQVEKMVGRLSSTPRSLLQATPATGSLYPAPAGTCDPGAAANMPAACVAREVKAPAVGSQARAVAGEAGGGRRGHHLVFRRGYLAAEVSAVAVDAEAAARLATEVARSLDTLLVQRLEQ